MFDLAGRTALVTGASGGIGGAIARALHARGAVVALSGTRVGPLEELAGALGERAHVLPCDLGDAAAVEALPKRAAEAMGSLEILVNNAGITKDQLMMRMSDEDWARVIDINLNGVFNTCRAVLPHMVAGGYGRVVNIASIAGKEGNPNAGPYAASKAGVIGLTKSLGKEHATQDIAINCVPPAAARTRIFDQLDETFIAFMLSKIPRGRFLEVSEAAEMITWLCTRANSFTTGAVFDLSGGRATY